MHWVVTALAAILIGCVDRFVYWMASMAYDVFQVASRINIFGGEGKMMDIYNGFTDRIYTALSIVMIFVFAYKMLMMIVDPDGNKQNTTGLIKDVVITVICIIVMPLLFRYMTVFQNHVIDDNVIFKFVLGTDGDIGGTGNPGRDLSMIVLMSFYHPYDLDSTFFSPITQEVVDSGNTSVIDKVKTDCVDKLTHNDNVEDHHFFQTETGIIEETCKQYVDGIVSWRKSHSHSPAKLLGNDGLYSHLDETMDYYWFICTGAGIMLCWFFVSYALDLGTRAVKLAFLEVIAPIPLIMRIIPNAKKSFDTWKNEIIKTYLEVFIRVAVIAFIVQLCIMVPTIISSLFDSIKNIDSNILLKIISTVILILGLLKFAKDAPSLFKAIFTTGGTLFEGLNLKPGVKSRVEDNAYAMKGLSYGASAVGRTRALFKTNYLDAYDRAKFQNGKTGHPSRIKSAAWGAWGVLSHGGNILTGAFKDNMGDKSAKTLKDMKGQMQTSGRYGKQQSLNRIAINDAMEAGADKGLGERIKRKIGYGISKIEEWDDDREKAKAERAKEREYIYGKGGDFSAVSADINDMKESNKRTYAPYQKGADKEEARFKEQYAEFAKDFAAYDPEKAKEPFKHQVVYMDKDGVYQKKDVHTIEEFNALQKESIANSIASQIVDQMDQEKTVQYQKDTLKNIEKIMEKNSEVSAIVNKFLGDGRTFDEFAKGIENGISDDSSMVNNILELNKLVSAIDRRVQVSEMRTAQEVASSTSTDKK